MTRRGSPCGCPGNRKGYPYQIRYPWSLIGTTYAAQPKRPDQTTCLRWSAAVDSSFLQRCVNHRHYCPEYPRCSSCRHIGQSRYAGVTTLCKILSLSQQSITEIAVTKALTMNSPMSFRTAMGLRRSDDIVQKFMSFRHDTAETR